MKIQDFAHRKRDGVPISMVTCYDAWSAALIADTDIDCILVGDSLAMVVYGHDTTLPVDVDTMAGHVAAVRRGAPDAFIIGDMPFLSYRCGLAPSVRNAGALMQAGANAVKLEGAAGNLELVRHLVESGIPVMGHLGLTPQSVHRLGGFRVQARQHLMHELIHVSGDWIQHSRVSHRASKYQYTIGAGGSGRQLIHGATLCAVEQFIVFQSACIQAGAAQQHITSPQNRTQHQLDVIEALRHLLAPLGAGHRIGHQE